MAQERRPETTLYGPVKRYPMTVPAGATYD
jgi:hypothetical protein